MGTNIQMDALKGLKVCLIGNYVPGPLAGYLLRSLGAEVIKVEPPSHDMIRPFPPYLQGEGGQMGAWFRALNAGFKSIVIDLKKADGVHVLKLLLEQSDILIDGNRPGYLERVLGESLSHSFPQLIHVAITAYGLNGPWKNKAGHDGNTLSIAGNYSYTASDARGGPAMFSAPVADILAAHNAVIGALTLWIGKKANRPSPQTVDASLLHSAFFLNMMQVAAMNLPNQKPSHDQAWMNGGLANYTLYMCADNKAILMGAIEPHLFARFCEAVGRPEWAAWVYTRNDALKAALKDLFLSRNSTDWEMLLQEIDCCVTPVLDLDEAMEHPQVTALGLVQEVDDPRLGTIKLAGFPAGFGGESLQPLPAETAPFPGEHTLEICGSLLGLDDAKIQSLLSTGAIATQ